MHGYGFWLYFPIWASALRHLIWKSMYLIFQMLSSCWRLLLVKHWILCSLEEKNFLNWSTVMYNTALIFDVFSRDYLRPKHIHKRSVCPSESEDTFSTYVSGWLCREPFIMNNSSSEAAPFDLEPTFSYSVATCYIVISLVAIVGNLLVCYAILTNRELRDNPANLLLLSLAISDLLTVTLDALFDVEVLFLHGLWKHWKALCITWLTVYLITVPSSVLTLLAISVDRYNTIRDPLARSRRSHFMTKKRAVTISLLVWVYCIVWSLLPIIGWRDRNEEPIFEGACMTPYDIIHKGLLHT